MSNKKKKNENVNNMVHIVIKKKIADDTLQIYAQFDAEEIVMDGVRTLFAESINFRQDATVRENPEIKEYMDMLKSVETREEKIKVVRDAIIKAEKELVGERSKGDDTVLKSSNNKKEEKESKSNKERKELGRINILDHQAKLIKLKICENVLKYDGRGSYVIFLPDGKRQYEYMYEDGVLFPIKHLVMEHNAYVNEGSMVRIHSSWVNRLSDDLKGTEVNHWGNIWAVIIIIATVLCFIGGVIFLIIAQNNAMDAPVECAEILEKVSNNVVDIAKSVNARMSTVSVDANTTISRQIQQT